MSGQSNEGAPTGAPSGPLSREERITRLAHFIGAQDLGIDLDALEEDDDMRDWARSRYIATAAELIDRLDFILGDLYANIERIVP